MKLKQLVRFSPLKTHENGPVTVKKIVNTKNILQAINEQPGMGTGEIAHYLSPTATGKDVQKISSIVNQLLRQKGPARIKRIELDRYYRYYPANYKLSTDPKPVADPVLAAEPEPAKAEVKDAPKTVPAEHPYLQMQQRIERKAMEYAWEHPDTYQTLKEFSDWYKGSSK